MTRLATLLGSARSDLALYAEGTPYTTDALFRAYRDYAESEEAAGREPDDAGRWAEAQEWLRSHADHPRAADA